MTLREIMKANDLMLNHLAWFQFLDSMNGHRDKMIVESSLHPIFVTKNAIHYKLCII